MHNFKIDLPVLLIFFVRPEPLAKVFEQVKIARPSKLYLYQDGARENRSDDVENIFNSDIRFEIGDIFHYGEVVFAVKA